MTFVFPLHQSNSDYFSGLFPPISSHRSLTRSLSGQNTKHTKNIATTMASVISPRQPPPSNLWHHHHGGYLRRCVPTRRRLWAAIIPSRPLLRCSFSHGDGSPSPPSRWENAPHLKSQKYTFWWKDVIFFQLWGNNLNMYCHTCIWLFFAHFASYWKIFVVISDN